MSDNVTKALTAILFLFSVLSCGQRRNEDFKPLPFPEMRPPEMITDLQDRTDWMALHCWDAFADTSRSWPCDSLLVSGVRKSDVEQKFADWVHLLEMVHHSVAEKSAGILCRKALDCETADTASNVLETMTVLVEKYLYDPNSPYRNEDIYRAYTAVLATWDGLSPELKGKYERLVSLCSLNRTGTKATDFRFSDRNGRMQTLYGVKAPMTLLFFSNPGCKACMDIINVLKGEPRIAELISSGRLAVLNIYIDEDIAAWRSYMPVYPEEWHNGFDPDMVIRNETLYNVRAIPSLYLLDEDKTVIMKDAPESRVFDYLAGI